MASKRRSTRLRKVPVKYFKEDSSEDEEDAKYKDAKLKLKQMINDDSDAESDFEAELIKSVEKYNSDNDDVGEENKMKDIEILREISDTVDNSLCLSESDSSDDDRMELGVKTGVSREENIITTEEIATFPNSLFPGYNEENEEESSKKLLELAGNLERMKDVWNKDELYDDSHEEKENIKNDLNILPSKKSTRKSARNSSALTPSKDLNLDNIAKLLAAGEGVSNTRELGDASDDDSDTKPCEPIFPTEGVEITVQLPKHLKKKKRKGFDVAAFLKRKLSRARRELALVQHKCHITCLLGHMFYLQKNLSSRFLLGLALSVVPGSHCHTPLNLTLINLGSLTGWVRENIHVDRQKIDRTTNSHIAVRLIRALESWEVVSDMELVLVFILICRAMGFYTRLVLNCHTLPIKPSENIKSKIDPNTIANTVPKNEPGKCKKTPEQTPIGSVSEDHINKRKTRNAKIKTGIIKKSKSRVSVRLSTDGEGDEIQDIEKYLSPDANSLVKIEPKSVEKSCVPQQKKRKNPVTTSKASSNTSTCRDYWVEVFVVKEAKWVTVDLLTGKVGCPGELESKASKPMLYVMAINNSGKVKDVTQRYASNFLTQTRKLRVEQAWLEKLLINYKETDDCKEDLELARIATDAPLPTSIAAFKDHPLYALQRHLLKFEAIYPPTAPTLGFIKGEAVYARECVRSLQGRTSWLKEGKVVRVGEEPYKVVKARPKWDRMSGKWLTEEPLDVFGEWQVELYIPPPAKNGIVPRNEYGNVELFKPWMLPAGCVQIPINGMHKVIRQLGIDAAPAMVGWDFSGWSCHPVFDGYVVCEENKEKLLDAWNKEQELKVLREKDKREKRVLDNWKKLVKGLMFRQKIQMKYMNE